MASMVANGMLRGGNSGGIGGGININHADKSTIRERDIDAAYNLYHDKDDPQARDRIAMQQKYKKEYGELYKADKDNVISYNCEYEVKTSILDKSDKYLAYVADVYIYGGGAHGMSVKIVKNIDKASGKIMSLRNVFVPGYEHELNQLILRKLYKKFDVNNLNELHEKTVFLGIDVYPSENFIIGDKSIIFIYSPDEIAFHAAGEIVVEIDKDDLTSLLRKDIM